jgi:hypothetical protein
VDPVQYDEPSMSSQILFVQEFGQLDFKFEIIEFSWDDALAEQVGQGNM